MKSFIILIIMLLNAGICSADLTLMSAEEIQLRQKFAKTPTREEVVDAFSSRHYLLHEEAIKWMIINRDTRTWDTLKEQKGKLKENSLKLYPILDFIAEQATDGDKPLALALKPEHLQMLVKKGEALPPRYEYSYIKLPLDEVLYEILAKDLERFPATNKRTADAARLLMQYRAPSAALEEAVKRKISQTEEEPQKGKMSELTETPQEEVAQEETKLPQSVASERPSEKSQDSVSSSNPHTAGKIAVLVAAVCAALFFCFKLVKSR